jgi:hypothetical protein
MSFNPFPGKAEVELRISFENFMRCVFMDTCSVTSLINFVKKKKKVLQTATQ